MKRTTCTNNRMEIMRGEGAVLDFFKSGLSKGRNFLGNLLKSDATKQLVNNLVQKGVERGSDALAKKLAGNGLRLAGQRGRGQRGRGIGLVGNGKSKKKLQTNYRNQPVVKF